jgi:hypothetical protein
MAQICQQLCSVSQQTFYYYFNLAASIRLFTPFSFLTPPQLIADEEVLLIHDDKGEGVEHKN